MRDNYVGDVGDFYKYSLLRRLCGATGEGPKRKLGVIWYLYPDPCKETDGLHLAYLSPQKRDEYHPADPELYDKLGQLIADTVRQRGLLPADTVFFEEPLSLVSLPKGSSSAVESRLAYRRAWLGRALEATKDCDIVFFDPDNGLEVASVKAHQDKGPKYTFYDELLPFWQRGQSLVIYQHKNMHQTAEVQIAERKRELAERLGYDRETEAFYFPKWGGRIFFVCK